jgi:hypothetical protein
MPGTAFNWRHGTYADGVAATVIGRRESGYGDSGCAVKDNFMFAAPGHWSFDAPMTGSLTSQRQMLNYAKFEATPTSVYSPAFAVPRIELSMPSVTGLVIKPSM